MALVREAVLLLIDQVNFIESKKMPTNVLSNSCNEMEKLRYLRVGLTQESISILQNADYLIYFIVESIVTI